MMRLASDPVAHFIDGSAAERDSAQRLLYAAAAGLLVQAEVHVHAATASSACHHTSMSVMRWNLIFVSFGVEHCSRCNEAAAASRTLAVFESAGNEALHL